MNIFYLDENPITAAKMQCDKHVVKMIVETAQLLSTAHRELDGDEYADYHGLHKSAYKNHPSAVWVRSNDLAYNWTWIHFDALLQEYYQRYGKIHRSQNLLGALSLRPNNILKLPRVDNCRGFEQPAFIPPPQCMPPQYKQDDTVLAYRDYYINEKSYMAQWKFTEMPSWFKSPIEWQVGYPSDTGIYGLAVDVFSSEHAAQDYAEKIFTEGVRDITLTNFKLDAPLQTWKLIELDNGEAEWV